MTSNATSTSTQASGNIPPASPVIESPQLRDDLVASLVVEVLALHRKYDDLVERVAAMSTEIVTGSIVVRDDAGLMSTRIDAGSIHIEHAHNGTAVGSFVSIPANPGSAEVQIGSDLSDGPGDPTVTATMHVDGETALASFTVENAAESDQISAGS